MSEERYASDVTDFRTQLTKLLGTDPDGLHIAAQAEFSGGTIVKQVRELGYEGAIYSEIIVVGTTALEIAGDAATGMKAVIADLDPANNTAQEVLANFREEYDYVTLAWYLGSAYDDVYISAECLKKTDDDQDADGFRDCLYDISWERRHRRQLQLRRKRRGSWSFQCRHRGSATGRENRRKPGLQSLGRRARPSNQPMSVLAARRLAPVNLGQPYGISKDFSEASPPQKFGVNRPTGRSRTAVLVRRNRYGRSVCLTHLLTGAGFWRPF